MTSNADVVAASTRSPAISRTVADLRRRVGAWRKDGLSVALVPTMGFLHVAHVKLIERARVLCDRVVVSIFVNPAQFGEGEDFDHYPRDEAGDLAQLGAARADLAWMPSVAEMYPDGFATKVAVSGLTEGLCGAARPGHFDGVASVVTKLFLQCRPDVALFGEKDYQQLQMIRRMTTDLDIGVAIEAVATVREADGLAISSRNVYLDEDERARAGRINKVLGETATDLAAGADVAEAVTEGRARLVAARLEEIEYLELRDAETLAPVSRLEHPARLLTAIQMGRTRLIDNVPVTPPVI